jgi:hypothetical protein
MSIENPEFFSSVDEEAKYVAPTDSGVTNGARVGGDTPQNHTSDVQSDIDSKKEDEKEKKQNTLPKLSIDEMQKYVDAWKHELQKVAWMNPDWPPAAWNPEAESKIAWNMENSLNMVA